MQSFLNQGCVVHRHIATHRVLASLYKPLPNRSFLQMSGQVFPRNPILYQANQTMIYSFRCCNTGNASTLESMDIDELYFHHRV